MANTIDKTQLKRLYERMDNDAHEEFARPLSTPQQGRKRHRAPVRRHTASPRPRKRQAAVDDIQAHPGEVAEVEEAIA
jgi:hypothetical protein